jgi:hypothetical protein
MAERLRALVEQRAGNRCEYCGIPQEPMPISRFHLEHIQAKKHGGADDPSNRALACISCNLSKGPNLAGIDSATGKMVALFNPRTENWATHFERRGPLIVGLTPTGRATVTVLNMNDSENVELRAKLLAHGKLP